MKRKGTYNLTINMGIEINLDNNEDIQFKVTTPNSKKVINSKDFEHIINSITDNIRGFVSDVKESHKYPF